MKKLLLLSIAFVAVQADTQHTLVKFRRRDAIPIKPGWRWMGHGPAVIYANPRYDKKYDNWIDPKDLQQDLNRMDEQDPYMDKVIGYPTQLNQQFSIDVQLLKNHHITIAGVNSLPEQGYIVCDAIRPENRCMQETKDAPEYAQQCGLKWNCKVNLNGRTTQMEQ